jgi:hypothetical protein
MSTHKNEKNIVLKPEVLEQAARQAQAEGKTVDELANELLAPLLKLRTQSKSDERWQSLLAYGKSQAKKLGIKESDVTRLVKEWRTEQHGR